MSNAPGKFDGPWRPGSDQYNADPRSMLRVDNTTLDENGILSLRLGSRLVSQNQVPGGVDILTSPADAFMHGYYSGSGKTPTAGVDMGATYGGSTPWTNPSNIGVGGSASCPAASSTWLVGRTFGFNIPADAVIVGVYANVTCTESGAGTLSFECKLNIWDGSTLDYFTGQVNKTGTANVAASLTDPGGMNDLWGITNLTPAMVNSPYFGLGLRTINKACTGALGMQMAITYRVEGNDDAGAIVALSSVVFDGAEKVVSADDSQLFIDGELIDGATFDGDDVAIGFNRGHLLAISGNNKYKYDNVTLRNWGIEAPSDAPDVSVLDVASKTVADFTQASAEFTASEGTKSYVTGYDGTANAATGLQPAVGTGRGIMAYNFAAPSNLLDIQGNRGGDYDVFSFWVDDPQPEKFTFLDIDFGLSPGSDPFLTDYYHYRFGSIIEPIQVQLTEAEIQRSSDAVTAAKSEPEGQPPPPEEEYKDAHRDEDQEERKRRRQRENPD